MIRMRRAHGNRCALNIGYWRDACVILEAAGAKSCASSSRRAWPYRKRLAINDRMAYHAHVNNGEQ